MLLADARALIGGKAIDAALDIEQRVDAPDRLQRNRRDRRGVLAAPGIGRDVGQFEELPPGMGPTQCRGDRSSGARGIVERIVAVIGIGLQDAAEALKVQRWMLMPPVTRCVVEEITSVIARRGPPCGSDGWRC